MKNVIKKLKNSLVKNYLILILGGGFLLTIISGFYFVISQYLTFYSNRYISAEAVITNIEQYEYRELSKNYVGLKIEYSYLVNKKEYKYEYKGALTDKVYNVGDFVTIYYSLDDPENVILNPPHFSIPFMEGKFIFFALLLLILCILYFGFFKKKFVFDKKNIVLYVLFIVGFSADIFLVDKIIDVLKININYEKTEAIVDRTYTYSEMETCIDNSTSTCSVGKTGALYLYEVNNVFYDASQLEVSSKTKYGDKKTIYYSPENPMYYYFDVNKDLIMLLICLFLVTSFTIVTNPFTRKQRKKKKSSNKINSEKIAS